MWREKEKRSRCVENERNERRVEENGGRGEDY